MKCLAGESAGSFVIEGIAEQRMADVSHVDADLVLSLIHISEPTRRS